MSRSLSSALAVCGALGLALSVASAGCSSSSSRQGFDGSDPPQTPPSEAGAPPPSLGNVDKDAAAADGCSDDAKLVYVLSLEGDLYSFAPAAKQFTKVGPLNCKSGSTTFIPISMAIDRKAVAWVNMRPDDPSATEDTLFKVDTKTAACTETNVRGDVGGMGFSTDEGTTDKETLFVTTAGSSFTTGALATIDFTAGKVVTIGDFQGAEVGELTGTGDGRLYGFVPSPPMSLVQLDKKTATASNPVALDGVLAPVSPMYAFSFWGGDFYFYTADSTSASKTTTVARYRPSDGSLDAKYMTNIGFHIVGAGVSTCAPTTSPK